MTAIKPHRYLALAAVLLFSAFLPSKGQAVSDDRSKEGGPLVLQFDTNRTDLPPGSRQKIEAWWKGNQLGEKDRLFVVGYTDDRGHNAHNANLSRRRAQRVRQLMIDALGIKPEKIVTVGKGSENPVDSNQQPEGRNKNRRAEIYLSQALIQREEERPEPPEPVEPSSPLPTALEALLNEADQAVRLNKLSPALAKLHEARAVGGERYARWHALMGIVGFYGDLPSVQCRAHLQTALRMDPHQPHARDFIGRIEAREQFAAGRVTAAMGRTSNEPIPITAMAQAYEYMRLFEVRPVTQSHMTGRPVGVWECRDARRQTVYYFFDYAAVNAWSYDTPAAKTRRILPGSSGPFIIPEKGASAKPSIPDHYRGRLSGIWESEVFK